MIPTSPVSNPKFDHQGGVRVVAVDEHLAGERAPLRCVHHDSDGVTDGALQPHILPPHAPQAA